MEHRLAAILSADAAGYTRLLAEDQAATIRALGEARERFSAGVVRHRGRVIDTAGDNVLAEFPSALEAVRCSVELQRVLDEAAAALPLERRLLFRIGLHLGDVAAEDARIYGDGVNVAARLQTLAEPGGICLSAAIHENVRSRLDLPFHDLGEQSLKNFPRPVRAFRLGGPAPASAETPPPEPPDRPSLVVLPFANVSGDAEQEFFADGMSEDLITELARIPGYKRLGRVDEAIAKHRECLVANPDFFGAQMQLASIYAQLGEMNQARAALAELLRLRPDFSIARIPRVPTGRDVLVENLRKAGLPE